ncbi:hypothetical protein NQZ68_008396 [Dissostichus eleginoides]|nr:hypothetical protein NQZ68_008396 [Dissostichus eleginoides]
MTGFDQTWLSKSKYSSWLYKTELGLQDAAAQQRRRPSPMPELEDPRPSAAIITSWAGFIVREQRAENAPCPPQRDASTLLVDLTMSSPPVG